MDLKKSFLVLFFLAFVTLAWADKKKPSDNPVVTIHDGIVKGVWKLSTNGRYYASFEGIPFAAPPIGRLRLKVSFYLFTFIYIGNLM